MYRIGVASPCLLGSTAGVHSTELTRIIDSRRKRGGADPVVIGIGGGSGSGKSTIAAQLVVELGTFGVTTVNQDRFFKPPGDMPTYDSAFHGEPRPNFNHPDSFRHDEMIEGCRASLDDDVVIIEGILALHFPALRSMMHVRCYVAAPLEQILARRLRRNLAAGYGGTEEEIGWYNRECVAPYHLRFNAPTADHADVVIPNAEDASAARDRIVAEIAAAIRTVRPG